MYKRQHPELYYVNQGFSYSYYPSEDKVASIYPEYTISNVVEVKSRGAKVIRCV